MRDKRNIGYDFLRIISICLVVVIHANTSLLAQNQGSPTWIVVMLLTTLCLVAVPLFFMLSGALLLDAEKTIPLKELYTKRIPKQAIPFLLWSVLYIVVRIALKKIPADVSSFFSILSTPAYHQFWFMYTLLAVYLLLPFLQALVKNLEKQQMEYLLILWLIFSVLIPITSTFFPAFQISSHVDLILCEGYIGYFFLGYYLKKYCKNTKKKTSFVLVAVGLVLMVAGAIGEWQFCVHTNRAYEGWFFQSSLTPFVIPTVVGLFLGFQNREWKQNRFSVVSKMAEATLGVYYVHMLILTALEYTLFRTENLLLLVAKILATVLLSFLGSVLLRKVPIVRTLFFQWDARKGCQ